MNLKIHYSEEPLYLLYHIFIETNTSSFESFYSKYYSYKFFRDDRHKGMADGGKIQITDINMTYAISDIMTQYTHSKRQFQTIQTLDILKSSRQSVLDVHRYF